MPKKLLTNIQIKRRSLISYIVTFCLLLLTVGLSRQAWCLDSDYTITQKEKEDPKRYVYQENFVDPLGGFQYKYPLNLPSGTNGMAPTLTLVYNSNVSNGMLGMGWYLHGLPEIKRDFSYGATYSEKDHFLYSGEKLVAGSDGYYRPVRETFERIRPVNLSSANSYWEVILKNGTKLYFGYQSTAHTANTFGRISAAGEADKVYLWALSKVVDIHGNYYIVEYNQDSNNGDYYPERITYTQNEAEPLTAVRTVEFSYENRIDHNMVFIPTKVDQDRRLKWIIVRVGAKLLRKYRLDYEYGTVSGRSRMIAIQEYGNDGDLPAVPWVATTYQGTGKTLPLTQFEYQQGAVCGFNQAYSRTDLKKGGVKYTTGDFNGDGKTDLIITTGSGSVWQINTGTGSSNPAYQTQYSNSRYTLNNVQFTPADLNGDGRTDVIATTSAGSYWLLSNNIGNTYSPVTVHYRSDLSLGKAQFTPGDFNGDGKTDIIATTAGGSYWYHSVGTGNSYQMCIAGLRGDLHYGQVQFTPGDFNGDGKTDLIYTTSAASYWYISDGNGESYHAYSPYYRVDLAYGKVQYTPGDYNGDGKTDLIVSTGQGSYWYISTGDGGPYIYSNSRSDLRLGEVKLNPGDFNGDGKTDLIASNSAGSVWYISKWENNAYQTVNQLYRADLKMAVTDFITTDFNGDGKTDSLVTTSSVSLWNISNGTGNLAPDLLTTIKTPIGAQIGITYSPAVDVNGAVVSDAKIYPDVANANASFFVTQLTFNDGLDHLITDSYNYSNVMIHNGPAYEQASLGFAWIEKENTYNGATRTYYRQDDLDLRLLVDKTVEYGNDGNIYTETSYQYQKQPNVNYPAVNFIAAKTENTSNFNAVTADPVQHRVEYDYDNYGNVKLQDNKGDIAVSGDERRVETEYHYYIDNSTYLMLPAVERKYGIKLDGTEGLAAETRYYYNDNYNLERQELENGDRDVIIKYQYDSYGNLTAKTDGNGYTTSYTYDEQYQTYLRYQKSKFTEEIRYDALLRPELRIDITGQTWQTTYDTFSRVKTELAPGDTLTAPATRITYPDEVSNSSGIPLFPNVSKTERKVADGNYLEAYFYRDGFDRIVQEKHEAQKGWITADHIYDNSGRETKTSMPYYTVGPAYSAADATVSSRSYQFDPIGRVKQNTNPDGTYRRFYYSKTDTLTVDELGHVTNQRIVGNTNYAIKYTGIYPNQAEYAKVTNIFACDGIKTLDPDDNEFVTMQDQLGRKISSTDPLKGSWNFEYDANGNLTTQTDAKKQTISFSYDKLNRLIQKLYPDSKKVNYYYDEAGYGYANGKLTRVTYLNGAASYTYDNRGRQKILTQTITGLTRTKQLDYNGLDQVITAIYPDGEVVNYSYDNGDNLVKLSGAVTYLNSLEYFATDKISNMIYGSGARIDYDYYDTAVETDSSAGTACSYRLKQIRVSKSDDLINLNYQYDKAANIKVKNDSLNSKYSETYGYDDLNRMTSASSASYGQKTFRYDTLNNILEKDGCVHRYDATHPYTVVNDGRYAYSYDANGNQIQRSDGRILSWDYENRVTAITDGGTYYYDGDGRRIAKNENGVVTYYFFNDYEEEYKAGVKSNIVKYYFANNQRVAENSSVDGVRYYIQDHLGSTSAITDATGALVLRTNNAPYGEIADTQGDSSVRYTFTGKEQDGTGLYYFGARFYDPEVGRFISVDPAMDGVNWYAYCYNNPVKYIDPIGLTTIVDHDGNVTDVIDNGDTSIWMGESGDSYYIRVGSSYFTDTFNVGNYININMDKTQEIIKLAEEAKRNSAFGVLYGSMNSGKYDVKSQWGIGHNEGILLFGKYCTAEDAGNLLAGMNGATMGLSYQAFQRISGALHYLTNVERANKTTKMIGLIQAMYGREYGPAPLYGEVYQQYRMSVLGYYYYHNIIR
jgi:RHS repeat-associated protein